MTRFLLRGLEQLEGRLCHKRQHHRRPCCSCRWCWAAAAVAWRHAIHVHPVRRWWGCCGSGCGYSCGSKSACGVSGSAGSISRSQPLARDLCPRPLLLPLDRSLLPAVHREPAPSSSVASRRWRCRHFRVTALQLLGASRQHPAGSRIYRGISSPRAGTPNDASVTTHLRRWRRWRHCSVTIPGFCRLKDEGSLVPTVSSGSISQPPPCRPSRRAVYRLRAQRMAPGGGAEGSGRGEEGAGGRCWGCGWGLGRQAHN